MARTNKMGILKKKQQQAKQKKLIGESDGPVETVKKSFVNPKGNSYLRVKLGQKYICDTTSRREDPDGFRIRRSPNGGEVEFAQTFGWGYKKFLKKFRKMSLK